MSNSLVPWKAQNHPQVNFDSNNPSATLALAKGIKNSELEMLSVAIKNDLHQMAVEFIWKRAISKLMSALASFGTRFIGEMLDRSDIPDNANLEQYITPYNAIELSSELGLIDRTGAIRLRQNLELLLHFSSNDTEELPRQSELISLIENSIQYILQQGEAPSGAMDFRSFRSELFSKSLTEDDPKIKLLINSPYFFKRTAIRSLLAALKDEDIKGATRQHVVVNLTRILPSVWEDLAEEDRYSVGRVYAEASNEGDMDSVKALRIPLGKVSGFDYVPETIRSNTFRIGAQEIKKAHNNFNNFYNEPAPTRELASLGSVIPKPALGECMSAYLVVVIGNKYGVSINAAEIARQELKKIPYENWVYYFERVFLKDADVLWELQYDNPAKNFSDLMRDMPFAGNLRGIVPSKNIVDAALDNKPIIIQRKAQEMRNKLFV